MKTKILKINETNKESVYLEAASIIKNGGLVVFPTETVYGIGANALNKEASKKIYHVKGRPSDNPLIVHISDYTELNKYVLEITEKAKKLIIAFWPGPLTIILNKNDLIPSEITGGLNTVAVRCPKDEIARNIIKYSNLPICAPSANISGKPSSTLFEHVLKDINGKVDMIIDGGKSIIGIESTVLDLTSSIPTILRPGAITKEMIEKVLNMNINDFTDAITSVDVPKAPGMKYKHYSPSGEIKVVFGIKNKVISYINMGVKELELMNKKVAVICAKEYYEEIECLHKVNIGSINDIDDIGSNLFSSLRKMDELGIEYILIHEFPLKNLGTAIMNRLLKASGNNKVELN